MHYLSLFFILSGLLVFFYSAFRDAGSPLFFSGRSPAGKSHTGDAAIEKRFSGEGEYASLQGDESIEPAVLHSGDMDAHEGIHHEISEHLLSEEALDEGELLDTSRESPGMSYGSPGRTPGEDMERESGNPNESYSFILFDDRSSVIDYRNGFGNIDPSLKEYKNIKRMGNGRFLLDREGINFYMKKKQFRFDFYRINEIVTGSNYIAAFVKGSEAVKLFVVENETELIDRVQRKFLEYNESHR